VNVDRARVRIRERAPTEVLDLAFVFIKANARAFALVAAVLVVPATVLVVAAAATTGGAASWYLAWVGCVAASTAIRGPLVLLCGHAMFAERVPLATVLADTRRHLPQIAGLVARRTALSLTVVGVVWEWFVRYHADEVLLLERLSGPAAATRLEHLRRRFGSQSQEQLVQHSFLGLTLVVSAASSWVLGRLVFANQDVAWWPKSAADPVIVGSILASQVYFAAAKFLFYLNLRTVNEGWDLFLETRAIEALVAKRRAPLREGTKLAHPPAAGPSFDERGETPEAALA